jgi:broad specificity phosphatase PhoE
LGQPAHAGSFRADPSCATQRNLSDEGRAQAVRIGDLFRANVIAAARLYASQWCDCLAVVGRLPTA